jgi:ribosomal protein S12 methylthiotransferase accessory factor
VEALTGAGCRVAYVDLTTDDVAPYGIRVVRTIATGLQPIHFGHGEERLGGRRLFEVPRALGHATASRTEADLNPCPHPLA